MSHNFVQYFTFLVVIITVFSKFRIANGASLLIGNFEHSNVQGSHFDLPQYNESIKPATNAQTNQPKEGDGFESNTIGFIEKSNELGSSIARVKRSPWMRGFYMATPDCYCSLNAKRCSCYTTTTTARTISK